MLRLYSAGGSSEIDLVHLEASAEDWMQPKQNVIRLLQARRQQAAADLLAVTPFEIYSATNGFGDDFHVLYLKVPPEEYVRYESLSLDQEFRGCIRQIAEAGATLLQQYIRFIAVAISHERGPSPVASRVPKVTSAVVDAALADAEHLLASRGATSAVDRAHTAFHGYLALVAAEAGIAVEKEASITQLFKALRGAHPALAESVDPEAKRVLGAMATVVDALNMVRNRKSLAHPNADLIAEADAMLMINSVRTLLHYLDARLAKRAGG